MEDDVRQARCQGNLLVRMNWVKDVSEFLLPNNTGTTPEEFFELMNVAKRISNNVTSVESTKHYIYHTKQ